MRRSLLPLSLLLVLPTAALADALARESGALPAGASYVAPGMSSPVTRSQRFILDPPGLDLAAGVELPLTAPDGALVVLVPRAGAPAPARGVALRDVAGARLEPGASGSGVAALRTFSEPELASYDLPSQATVLELGALPAGAYHLEGPSAVASVLVAEPASSLELRLRTSPLAARAGEPVLVEALLRDGDAPVSGAVLTARWSDARGSHELALGERRPGRYVARLVPEVAGGLAQLEVRVDAAGSLADGRRFARTGLTGAMVTAPRAGLAVDEVTLGPGGLEVPVSGRSGRYRLEAVFARGDAALAFSREDFVLASARSTALPLPAAAHGADRVAVRLLNLDTLGLEEELELELSAADLAFLPLPDPAAAAATPPALPPSKLRARERFHEEP